MSPLVSLAASIFPSIFKMFTDDDDKIKIAEEAADIAKTITGNLNSEEALLDLQNNKENYLKVQEKLLEFASRLVDAEVTMFNRAHDSYNKNGGQLINKLVMLIMIGSYALIPITLGVYAYIMSSGSISETAEAVIGPLVGSFVTMLIQERSKVLEFLMGNSISEKFNQFIPGKK